MASSSNPQRTVSQHESISDSGSKQSSNPGRDYASQIDSVAIRRMLSSFPMDELSARTVGSTEFNKTLFKVQVTDGVSQITVPKNIEAFSNNLLMSAILKSIEIKQWIPILSDTELPPAVLETNDAAFFAGWVAGALRPLTGPLVESSSKYNKGLKAYQTYCVAKRYGSSSSHLLTGGEESLGQRLSAMKGFTKEYWSIRATISTLFKSLPIAEVTDLSSYMASKQDIVKKIKTKFVYKNGGVFRPEEIQYMDSRFHEATEALSTFLSSLDAPNVELARDFATIYGRVKALIDGADNQVRLISATRSKILFPNDGKQKSAQFAKKSLSEKLHLLAEDKLVHFYPESLPGIDKSPTPKTLRLGTEQWKAAAYPGVANNESAISVIDSWVNDYWDPEGSDQ